MVSLLNDAASEMIAPLFPLFLTVTLGGAPAMLGLVEGAADATGSVLKLVSGRLADRPSRRKPLVLAGYTLAAATRPLLAFAPGPWTVFALRITDRIGKGIRTSPRDTLLAAGAPPSRLGSVFGFHRAMDHAGAVVGGLLAAAALASGVQDIRTIFLWSVLPAIGGVALVALVVRDPGSAPPAPAKAAPTKAAPTKAAPPAAAPITGGLLPTTLPAPPLRWFLGAVLLFGLGHASDAFLLLKAGEAGVPTATLPLLWVALHVVKSIASGSAGPVADRFGRRRVIAVGWIVAAGIYLGFAAARSTEAFAALFVVYGLYHGLTEGAEKAVAVELGGRGTGTALGWYNLASGLVALPAGVAFGLVWSTFGADVAFGAGAALALLALVPLAGSARRPTPARG